MAAFDTDNGILLADDEALGSGGRGSVLPVVLVSDCAVSQPAEDLVCKVVERRFRTVGRERKVGLLKEIGATAGKGLSAGCSGVSDVVAWPLCNVYEDGEWAGYAMRRVRGRSLSEIRDDVAVSFEKKIELASRMCGLVSAMHSLGIVVGDVNMANMIYDEAADQLVVVDIDSVQVVDTAERTVYPTVESREKSPEMLGGSLGDKALSTRSDDFLVAVEIFRTLFDAHPFDEYRKDVSVGKVRAENVKARRFAYDLSGAGCGMGVFGDELADLFRRSFAGSYERIPSARAYEDALRALESSGFERCQKCGLSHVAKSISPSGIRLSMPGFATSRFAGLFAKFSVGVLIGVALAHAVAPYATEAVTFVVEEGSELIGQAEAAVSELRLWIEGNAVALEEWASNLDAWASDLEAWASEALACVAGWFA